MLPGETMSDEQTSLRQEAEQLQVLTFDMQGETFAIEAGIVREILDHMPETAVPGAPAMVSALVNFRGRVIPLADLHREFGFSAASESLDSRIIVIELEFEGEDTLVGLRADKVHEVTVLERASTEVPPRVGMRWRADFIRCIAKRAGDFIIVPDLKQIFAIGCGTAAAASTQH